MKLIIRKLWDCDFYVIERFDHDGRSWEEKVVWENGVTCYSHQRSARFSGTDADVEGSRAEMLSIADAIERQSSVSFKRCRVDATSCPVLFSSPKNSTIDGKVPFKDALNLAKLIKILLEE